MAEYDFYERVEEARQHWEIKLQYLVKRGMEKEMADICFEVTKLSKKTVKITFASKDVVWLFVKFQRSSEIIKIQEALKPRLFKIVGDSIITAGEQGLSVFSHVMGLIYAEIKERLKIRAERLKKIRKILFPQIKEIFSRASCCEKVQIRIARDGNGLYGKKMKVDIKLRVKMPAINNKVPLPVHLSFEGENPEEIIRTIERTVQQFK